MERIDLQKQEADKREQLLTLMKKKELEVYEDAELELRVVVKPGAGDKVSVKKLASADD